MNDTSPQLLVAVLDGAPVIKITGRANFTLSVDFKRLIHSLRERGHRQFALELSGCQMMDSTFLGVLAGLGLKSAEQDPGAENAVCLLGANSRILDMLDNLGVRHLFRAIDLPAAAPADFRPVEPAPAAPPKVEISRTCLEAHQLLMALNPANVEKFKDVTAFLAEDVKRLEGGAK
jgi:anti-anti-sigma regulatory factor